MKHLVDFHQDLSYYWELVAYCQQSKEFANFPQHDVEYAWWSFSLISHTSQLFSHLFPKYFSLVFSIVFQLPSQLFLSYASHFSVAISYFPFLSYLLNYFSVASQLDGMQ